MKPARNIAGPASAEVKEARSLHRRFTQDGIYTYRTVLNETLKTEFIRVPTQEQDWKSLFELPVYALFRIDQSHERQTVRLFSTAVKESSTRILLAPRSIRHSDH